MLIEDLWKLLMLWIFANALIAFAFYTKIELPMIFHTDFAFDTEIF